MGELPRLRQRAPHGAASAPEPPAAQQPSTPGSRARRAARRAQLRATWRRAVAAIAATELAVLTLIALPQLLWGWRVWLPWLLAIEAGFGLVYALFLSRTHLCPQPSMLAAPPDYDPKVTKRKLIAHLKRMDDIVGSMRSWFIDCSNVDDIKRLNLMDLFAYAVWYKSVDQMAADGQLQELEDLVAQLERHSGRPMPEGHNPSLRFMSHLTEPVRHVYRPLVFYAVMESLALLSHAALLSAGFSWHELGGISYYTHGMGRQQLVAAISGPLALKTSAAALRRELKQQGSGAVGGAAAAAAAAAAAGEQHSHGADAGEPQLPIVFLHGVGAGLLPYLGVVFQLACLGRPLILPEAKHVSMRLVSWLPTVDDMADATAAIMAAHGLSKAAVMAHSYGTMVASRLVLKYEPMVHSLCLCDPVCFAMFMPDLIRNFLYTRHNSGCIVIDVIMALVSSELHCAANFSRDFYWTSINLWDEHIPARTLVVLSGRDILSPTAQVYRWLREHTHAQVLYSPGMAHAGMLVNCRWQAAIIEHFEQVMALPDGATPAPSSPRTPRTPRSPLSLRGPPHARSPLAPRRSLALLNPFATADAACQAAADDWDEAQPELPEVELLCSDSSCCTCLKCRLSLQLGPHGGGGSSSCSPSSSSGGGAVAAAGEQGEAPVSGAASERSRASPHAPGQLAGSAGGPASMADCPAPQMLGQGPAGLADASLSDQAAACGQRHKPSSWPGQQRRVCGNCRSVLGS